MWGLNTSAGRKCGVERVPLEDHRGRRVCDTCVQGPRGAAQAARTHEVGKHAGPETRRSSEAGGIVSGGSLFSFEKRPADVVKTSSSTSNSDLIVTALIPAQSVIFTSLENVPPGARASAPAWWPQGPDPFIHKGRGGGASGAAYQRGRNKYPLSKKLLK